MLGMALNISCDEIVGRKTLKKGIQLKLIGPNARLTPQDPDKNTITVAIKHMLKFLGEDDFGMELEAHKSIRPGSGLGSSAASAAAGVMMANELLGRPLEKRELLPFAILGEHAADGAFHADNVAPSLLGGMILTRDIRLLDVHRVFVPNGLYVSVVIPKTPVLTKEARGILSKTVPLNDMIAQSANLAALIHAMHVGDFGLIARSLQDRVIEPQRASMQHRFYDVQSAALNAGAMGCGISGSGPTIFAISANDNIANAVVKSIEAIYESDKIESRAWVSTINNQGAKLC